MLLTQAANITEKLTGKKINRERLLSDGLFQLLAKKTVGTPYNFESHRADAMVLCPEEHHRVHSAIYLDHHIARITGCNPLTTVDSELKMFFNQDVIHGASVLYKFDNVHITRGGLWSTSRDYYSVRVHQDTELEPVELASATYVDNEMSALYFAHWYNDFAPATLTATPERPALSCYLHAYAQIKSHGHSHAHDYANLFGLDVMYANKGSIKELYILEDYAQNSYKVSRYLELRKRLEKNLKPEDSPYKGVYIVRGQSGGKRNLENEPALIEHLSKNGFDILYPEKMTSEMIVKRLWNAPMIIGVDGGAVTHAMYTAKKNAPYMILMPPNRFAYHYKGFCDALDNPYGIYVCQPSSDDAGAFTLDSFADFDRLVDLLREESIKRSA